MRRSLVAALAIACVAEFPPPAGVGSSEIGDSTGGSSDIADGSGSVTTAATGSSMTSNATTGASSGASSGDATGDATDDPPNGLPNGEACTVNTECDSGRCFVAGILGGVCGECIADADCDWGCSPPNLLSEPPTGSYCSDGSIGGGCQTSDACLPGLQCKNVIDVPGVLTTATCGECIDAADCGAPRLCSPDIDVANLTGAWRCIEAGSKPLGGFCDHEGTGNLECASGICAVAEIMGLIYFGVCSECAGDKECAGTMCVAPTVDLDGTVVPGFCL